MKDDNIDHDSGKVVPIGKYRQAPPATEGSPVPQRADDQGAGSHKSFTTDQTTERRIEVLTNIIRYDADLMPVARRAEVLWELNYDPFIAVGESFSKLERLKHLQHLEWKCCMEILAINLQSGI